MRAKFKALFDSLLTGLSTRHLFVLLLATSAFADENGNPRVAEVCKGPSAIEGRYRGFISNHVELAIYLVCTGVDRIEASWLMPGSNQAVALPNIAIDDDQISFTSFSVAYDDSTGLAANGSPGIRLEASLAALKNGVLDAVYKTAQNPLPLHLRLRRDQIFPNLIAAQPIGALAHGTFRVVENELGRAKLKGPFYLDLDVINGIERVSLADSAGSVYYSLYMGMLKPENSEIFYASSGVGDDNGAMMPQIQIRGHMISADVFEFYYFNTLYGMSGKLHALRVSNLREM